MAREPSTLFESSAVCLSLSTPHLEEVRAHPFVSTRASPSFPKEQPTRDADVLGNSNIEVISHPQASLASGIHLSPSNPVGNNPEPTDPHLQQ